MKKKLFNFFLIIIFSLSIYSSLVILDIFLSRLPRLLSEDYKISQKIFWHNQIKSLKTVNKDEKYINQIYINDYQYYPFNKVWKNKNFIAFGPPGKKNYLLCDEGYGTIKYTSDRFGFRNNDYLWEEKIDTVLIGDSFVEGQCVEKKNTIAGILNKKKIKTLILGHGGTSALHYNFYLKTFIPALKPKKIIIALHENDNHLIDTIEAHSKFLLKIKSSDYISKENNQLQPSKNLIKFNKNILDFYQLNLNLSAFEKLLFYISKMKKYFYLANTRFYLHNLLSNELIGKNKLLIDNAISLCEKNGCKAYFILMRSSNFWDPNFFYENYKNNLENYLSQKGLNLITFDHLIDYKNRKFYAPKGPHFSILGYKLIADELLMYIND